jgi:hypothetical protein
MSDRYERTTLIVDMLIFGGGFSEGTLDENYQSGIASSSIRDMQDVIGDWMKHTLIVSSSLTERRAGCSGREHCDEDGHGRKVKLHVGYYW